MGSLRPSIAAPASIAVFIAFGVATATLLRLHGSDYWLLVGGMALLGIITAAIIWFSKRRPAAAAGAANAAAPAAAGGAIADILREADRKLATRSASIAKMPVVLLVGDQGSTKTSLLINSGVEPELLAGQIGGEGASVAATPVANVWLSRDTIFIEAAGKLLVDAAGWQQLIKGLRPGKLKSVLAGSGQAPRSVAVCFDAEAFTQQGGAEQAASTARTLHAKLGEISQQLGISFPVYALFTKADRIAFFSDFFSTLANDEALQVFGATLPLPATRSGVYAEQTAAQVNAAFDELFQSLCDRRLDYLPRDSDVAKRSGAYEFPREFRKIRNTATAFLVELCRPSQLRANPFLRGFYFCGVRPVVISEMTAAPARPVSASNEPLNAGATRMFRPGMAQAAQAAAAQAQPVAGTRRVPQWIFASALFNGIILQDRPAMSASGASTKTSFARRLIFGAIAAIALIYAAGATISYFNNRALENRALDAARSLETVQDTAPVASVASLQKLDTLRQSLADLTDYRNNGHGLALGWGLYTGDELLPRVRQVYYKHFAKLLFNGVQGGWLNYLRTRPATPAPNDDYNAGYHTLKAYLLTTAEFKPDSGARATFVPMRESPVTYDAQLQEFLGSTLGERWSAGREKDISDDQMKLARKQFVFYAGDLANGNPYGTPAEADAVKNARAYLAQFSGTERAYQALLTMAAAKAHTIVFNDDFKGSDQVIVNRKPVNAAFTKDGWSNMRKLINNSGDIFGGERWVLGTTAGQGVTDLAKLKQELQTRYVTDYINTWRGFVNASRFAGYKDIQDAGNKMALIVSSGDPLMALFWVASVNTNVDDPRVVQAFDAVRRVVPPNDKRQFNGPENKPYIDALSGLQSQISSLQTPPDPGAAAQAKQQAIAAVGTTHGLTSQFANDVEGHLDAAVTRLMIDPITSINPLLDKAGSGQANAAGAGFCAIYNQSLGRKFPFDPRATQEASLQEVNDVFKPGGRLWQFYDGTLKANLVCTSSGCTPTGTGQVKFTEPFLRFFGNAVKFSRAVYGENGAEPAYHYLLTPQKSDQVDAFIITVNGEQWQSPGGAAKQFVWPGPGSATYKLQARLNGGTVFGLYALNGVWSVFHFFADANASGQGAFEWGFSQGRTSLPSVNGRPLQYKFAVDAHGAPVIFSKEFLAGMKCVSQVAH